jgi:hypothetical protein
LNWRRRDLAGAFVGLLLLLAWDASGADLPLSRLFGQVDGFALRHHWSVQRVLHDGVAQGLHLVFLLLGVNVLLPLPVIGAMPRARRLSWWLMSLLSALAISLLKQQSRVSCPWSFAEFGGRAHELAHLSLAAWRGRRRAGPLLSGRPCVQCLRPGGRCVRAARGVDACLKAVAGGGVRDGLRARPDPTAARCPLRQPQPVEGLDLLAPERAAVEFGRGGAATLQPPTRKRNPAQAHALCINAK